MEPRESETEVPGKHKARPWPAVSRIHDKPTCKDRLTCGRAFQGPLSQDGHGVISEITESEKHGTHRDLDQLQQDRGN